MPARKSPGCVVVGWYGRAEVQLSEKVAGLLQRPRGLRHLDDVMSHRTHTHTHTLVIVFTTARLAMW